MIAITIIIEWYKQKLPLFTKMEAIIYLILAV